MIDLCSHCLYVAKTTPTCVMILILFACVTSEFQTLKKKNILYTWFLEFVQ